MRYRTLGIDLDGTLLNRRGEVGDANLRAIAAARKAGVLVVPCTGRSWIESRPVLDQLSGVESGVFVGGAQVSEIASGKTLDLAVIEPHLAEEMVAFLADEPEAVLVFRDANLVGHDYLVTGRGDLDANTRWWFEMTRARVHFQASVTPEALRHALRVGVVTRPARMSEVHAAVERAFAGRVVMHSFQAVQMPDPAESVHVLEVFGRGVDKWRGLKWLADRSGIDPSRIAVIGDEVNDLAMLRAAGCGIAMGNAIDAAKGAARHVTLDCESCGVAHAIERLLSGEWE